MHGKRIGFVSKLNINPSTFISITLGRLLTGLTRKLISCEMGQTPVSEAGCQYGMLLCFYAELSSIMYTKLCGTQMTHNGRYPNDSFSLPFFRAGHDKGASEDNNKKGWLPGVETIRSAKVGMGVAKVGMRVVKMGMGLAGEKGTWSLGQDLSHKCGEVISALGHRVASG